MRIKNLSVDNFRGIGKVTLSDLGTMVIIAGQNGSGKSCIFDAIKLIKSVYGGYHQGEFQQFLGEFQLDQQGRSGDIQRLLNDVNRCLIIECDFEFSPRELTYLGSHGQKLLEQQVWRELHPEAYNWNKSAFASISPLVRHREEEVKRKAFEELPRFLDELKASTIKAKVTIEPNGNRNLSQSRLLQTVFSTYLPENIGLIDHHGAHRQYSREQVNGINLSIDSTEQIKKQSTLYNYSAKYANVKSELASAYVKDAISALAGTPLESSKSLTATLEDLFRTFFPDKAFSGPKATTSGGLSFPVQVGQQFEHDLDELSSGEKEVLYGYLRIRNSTPKDSIILMDEPELHLNPRLVRQLPGFYPKHVGEAMGNQIFLVTHSDALLREVIGQPGYRAFHMIPLSLCKAGEQLKELNASADFERLIVDLVGDLPSYMPNEHFLILEGGLDSEFDKKVVSQLFPEVTVRLNLLTGTNKLKVIELKDFLSSAAASTKLGLKFYSVTDRDYDEGMAVPLNGHFVWDRYHIENYLLEAKYIWKVVDRLKISGFENIGEIDLLLRTCARECIDEAVRSKATKFINSKLISQIKLGVDPLKDLSMELQRASAGSLDRISTLASAGLDAETIDSFIRTHRLELEASILDASWVSKIPGRSILRRLTNKIGGGIKYEAFRNLIISEMQQDHYKPAGMEHVLNQVLSSRSSESIG